MRVQHDAVIGLCVVQQQVPRLQPAVRELRVQRRDEQGALRQELCLDRRNVDVLVMKGRKDLALYRGSMSYAVTAQASHRTRF